MGKTSPPSSSNKIALTILLLFLAVGGWFAWQSQEFIAWKEKILQYIENKEM